MNEPSLSHGQPKERFLRVIWNFTHLYHKNFLMCITGDPGEGKSLTACKIGEVLDKHFSIDKVCYTDKQFMTAVADVKFQGEVIIWDEAGVGLPSREWSSLSNRVINYVVQTFRKDNACVIFVTPDLSFIDVQARKLMRCYTEARRYMNNPVNLWLYKISVDRKSGNVYFPHPIFKVNGTYHKLKYAIIKKPSKELEQQYEEKAGKWKERLKKRVKKGMEILDTAEGSKDTVFTLINTVSKNREEYMTNGKLNTYKIMTKLGISEMKARQIRAMVGGD